MTIYNPFDTFTNAAGDVERRPFPGNIIPQVHDGSGRAEGAQLPAAAEPAGRRVHQHSNWFDQGINTSTGHQINIKGDHNFNENNRLSGRYSQARSDGTNPNLFGDDNPAYWTGGPNRTRTHSMVADLHHVMSAPPRC